MEVPPDSIVVGLANTLIVCMVTGANVNDTILKAPLSARAVIFRVVGRDLNVDGTTFTRTDAWPFVSVLTKFPRGNVASEPSEPNRTSIPATRRPKPLKTVAVTVTSSSLGTAASKRTNGFPLPDTARFNVGAVCPTLTDEKNTVFLSLT